MGQRVPVAMGMACGSIAARARRTPGRRRRHLRHLQGRALLEPVHILPALWRI